MTTLEKWQKRKSKLQEQYAQVKDTMIDCYEKGFVDAGDAYNDQCEKLLIRLEICELAIDSLEG